MKYAWNIPPLQLAHILQQNNTPEDTDDDLGQLIKEEEARLKAVQQEVEQLRKRVSTCSLF
jgi:hypothetical protein